MLNFSSPPQVTHIAELQRQEEPRYKRIAHMGPRDFQI